MNPITTSQSEFRSTKDVFFLDNDRFFASGNYTDGRISETGWMALWNFRRSAHPVWSRNLPHAPYSPIVTQNQIAANLNREIHFFDIKTGRSVDKRGQGIDGFIVIGSTLIYSLKASRELYRLNLKDNSKQLIPSKNRGSLMSLSTYAPDNLLLCRSSLYSDRLEKGSISVLNLSTGDERNILTGFYGFPLAALSKTRLLAVGFLNHIEIFDTRFAKIYEHDFTKGTTIKFLSFQDNVLRVTLQRNMSYIEYTLDTRTHKVQPASPKFPFYYPTSPDNSLVFSPPETIGSEIGHIHNLKTGKRVATLKLK